MDGFEQHKRKPLKIVSCNQILLIRGPTQTTEYRAIAFMAAYVDLETSLSLYKLNKPELSEVTSLNQG